MDENITNTADTAGATQPNVEEKKFSQAELDALIAERLKRQKTAFEAQQQKQKDEAEQRTLTEQQQFKELAQKHEARVKELEPLQSEVETLRAVVQQQLDVAKKDMPKHITALLDKMAPADQLAWIAENKAELTKPAAVDINATNRGASVSKSDRVHDAAQDLRKTGQYNLF